MHASEYDQGRSEIVWDPGYRKLSTVMAQPQQVQASGSVGPAVSRGATDNGSAVTMSPCSRVISSPLRTPMRSLCSARDEDQTHGVHASPKSVRTALLMQGSQTGASPLVKFLPTPPESLYEDSCKMTLEQSFSMSNPSSDGLRGVSPHNLHSPSSSMRHSRSPRDRQYLQNDARLPSSVNRTPLILEGGNRELSSAYGRCVTKETAPRVREKKEPGSVGGSPRRRVGSLAYIRCGSCSAAYLLPPGIDFGPNERSMHCTVCDNKWMQACDLHCLPLPISSCALLFILNLFFP